MDCKRLLVGWLLGWLATACQDSGGFRSPRAGDWTAPAAGGAGDLFEPPDPGPPAPDASGLCGNLIIPLKFERPNLYFVVDASGSMAERIQDSSALILRTRYQAAVNAIGSVLRDLGHRISFGAALLPGQASDATGMTCVTGSEVFATREGDPNSFALSGEEGPRLRSLLLTLRQRSPDGPTPTAATLRTLASTLTALDGETAVVLLTDGAPNCNDTDPCPTELCEYTIREICNPEVNCCDPQLSLGGWRNCVDLIPTRAVISDLARQGIHTFVIGLPGSEFFASILDELAIAGRTARAETPRYYPAANAEDLTNTLRLIGANVALSCDIELAEAPPDPTLVNVYFGDIAVNLDAADGWQWASDRHIQIVGPACDKLEAGEVLQIQVVAGCPTVIR